MRVYLSGPMSGYPYYNEALFDVAELYARTLGWDVVNPARKDRDTGIEMSPTGEPLPREQYETVLASDFADIDLCDAILLLPHWEQSEGACRELEHMGVGNVYEFSGNQYKTLPDVRAVNTSSRRIGDWSHVPAERLTDPVTGASKGMRVTRMDLIPPDALRELGAVYGFGERKYPAGPDGPNWMRGMPFSWNLRALKDHIAEWEEGKDYDDEDGVSPLAHAMWHLAALLTYQARGLGTDDRPFKRVEE